jgi:hypothetical protein
MQNEERINVLETQVRALKRFVCILFCVFMFVGCSSISDVLFIGSMFPSGASFTPDNEIGISEMSEAAQSDELCCRRPHHLECIVNTTSSPPGSCQNSRHLECGVITTD